MLNHFDLFFFAFTFAQLFKNTCFCRTEVTIMIKDENPFVVRLYHHSILAQYVGLHLVDVAILAK